MTKNLDLVPALGLPDPDFVPDLDFVLDLDRDLDLDLDLDRDGDRGIQAAPRSSANDEIARWLAARRLTPPAHQHWMIAIELDVAEPRSAPAVSETTRLRIEIDRSEFRLVFCRGNSSSSIRVRNEPCVHEHDDFGLLPHVTELRNLGTVVRLIERRFHVQFRRAHAAIHADLVEAAHEAVQKILLWVVSAL